MPTVTFLGAHYLEGSNTVVELDSSIDTTGYKALVIVAKHEGPATAISVQGDNDAVGTWTPRTKITGGDSSDAHAQAFIKYNATGSATDTPQVNFTDASVWGGLAVFGISGTDDVSLIAELAANANTDPIDLGDLVASADYAAVMMVVQYGQGAMTWAAPWTERDAEAHTMGLADATGTAGTVAATCDPATTANAVGVALLFQEGAPPETNQEAARFGADDGSESAHSFLGTSQDSPDISGALDTNYLIRLLVDATGDPASVAYTLRYQKNGAGGYVAVPVGTTTTTSPSQPTSGTATTIGTAGDPWSVNRATAVTGDMVVFVLAWDDSTDVTTVTAPSGPNGETAVSIAGPIASNGSEMRVQAWYYIATGTWSTGTLSFDPSTAETLRAVSFVVPAGQFNPSDPIGWSNTRASTASNESTLRSPTGTAESNDGDGRLFIAFGSDADAITAPASGTTTINNATGGGVGLCVVSRDALATNSESVAEITATMTSDSWASLAFVVKPSVVTNGVYVATSGNIAAGGEATTARLTPPSGKTTGDFVTGRRWDDENGTDTIDITTDDYTEVEWCVRFQSPAIATDYFDFRVYAGTNALTTYGVTPRLTLSAGETVTPPAGGLVLTGTAPTLLHSDTLIRPAAGALVLTGEVPNRTLSDNPSMTPPAGALVFTGSLPVQTYTLPAPAAAAIVLTGFAPTLGIGVNRQPPAGALSLTGTAPSLALTVTPPAGAVVLTGSAPTVDSGVSYTITPDAGVLVFTGTEPSISYSYLITPGAGAVTLAGTAPLLHRLFVVPAGALTLAGAVPVVGGSFVITPGAGTVALNGTVPNVTVSQSGQIQPAPANIVITGAVPVQTYTLPAPAAAAIVLTGSAPVVTRGVNIQPPAGSVVFTGSVPALHHLLVLPAGTVTLTGAVPTVTTGAGVTITPPAGSIVLASSLPHQILTMQPIGHGQIVLTGYAPSLSHFLRPPAGAMALGGVAPNVSVSQSGQIQPPAGTLNLSGSAPNLSESVLIRPGAGTLSLIGNTPIQHWLLTPPSGSIILDGSSPVVGGSFTINPPSAGAIFTGTAPNVVVSQAGTIQPIPGTITLTGYAPSLSHFIRPDSNQILLAGAEPLVGEAINREPPAASISLAGTEPEISVTAHHSIVPDAAVLTLDGFDPVVLQSLDHYITPNAALLQITSFAAIIVPVISHIDESRVWVVASEDRVWIVSSEDRTHPFP